MATRKILTDEDPVLHKVCRPVEKFDERLWQLLDDRDGGIGPRRYRTYPVHSTSDRRGMRCSRWCYRYPHPA